MEPIPYLDIQVDSRPLPTDSETPHVLSTPADDSISVAFEPFGNAPLAIVLVDQSGAIVRINQRLEKLFGFAADELLGKSIKELMPPSSRAHHDHLLEAFFDYPTTRHMSKRRDLAGQSKDGSRIPLEIGLTPFMIDESQFALAWIFDPADQTNKDEQFQLVVEGSPNGVMLVNEQGQITFCNKRSCDLFGYTRDELIGRSVDVLVPQRVARKHRVYRGNFHENPAQRSMGGDRDLFAVHSDGSEFPVEIGLTPIETPDSILTLATITDISERKESERKLLQNNEELLRFAYSASHDIKAPLATICGLSDIALEDLESGDINGTRSRLEDIQSKSAMLAELVERILALARTDHSEDNRSLISLSTLIGEVESELGDLCRSSQVRIETELRSQNKLLIDPERLRLVLRNLVENAAKYRNPERPDASVTIATHDAIHRVIIEVSDNGLGIPAHNHDQVFQMFRRFHASSAVGSGLGLAMVKKQVEYMKGRITFTSSKEGTTFRVELPARSNT